MKTLGIAAFCLLLGFGIGFSFNTFPKVEDAWISFEEQELNKIKEKLLCCINSLRENDSAKASRYASGALADCYFLQRDLCSYRTYGTDYFTTDGRQEPISPRL